MVGVFSSCHEPQDCDLWCMSIYQIHPSNGVARHYPASGSSVSVPLSSGYANAVVMLCRGIHVSETPKTPVTDSCGSLNYCHQPQSHAVDAHNARVTYHGWNGVASRWQSSDHQWCHEWDGGLGVCHCAMSIPVLGEIVGPKSGRDPSVSESNRLHVDTFRFFFMNLRYIP